MPGRSRARHLLDLAIPFAGVFAGAATVLVFYSPGRILPRPPYVPWLFSVAALAAFAGTLALGLEDGWAEDDTVNTAERWRALVVTYFTGILASGTYVVATAVIRRLD